MTTPLNDPAASHEVRPTGFDGWSWAAVGTSISAVVAWAACCVLPMSLAAAGMTVAGTALFAQQRAWLTALAAVVLALGWVMLWRRSQRCKLDSGCKPPSRLNVALMSVASFLLILAIVWQPLIEPRLLSIILGR